MKNLLVVMGLLLAAPVYAYDTVREGEYVWACIEDGEVVSRHDTQYRAVVDCGKLVDADGKERYIDFGGLRVFSDAPEPMPEPEPEPEPEPQPEPEPTASCGEPYRGIPDPCAHFGFDVYADYPVTQQASGNDLSCTGTATAPCVIDATGVTFDGRTSLSGQYAILQGGHVIGGRSNGAWFSAGGCEFCVIRDLEVSGPGTDQGHSSAVGIGSFNVWLRGSIHGFGDNRADAREQDYHGIKSTSGSDIWILDAEIYDVSGDSVQCGDASRGACERVYIGGGYFHDNRENGIDIKDSQNVVVSGVRMEGFAPTGSSSGVALVIHDDAYDARVYDNVIRDANIGIVSSGMEGHVIEGNDIEASSMGIDLRGTSNLTVRDNHIVAPQCLRIGGGASGDIQQGCD